MVLAKSAEPRSRAVHQNALHSEDGVLAPTHRETRYRRDIAPLVDAGRYPISFATN